MEMARRDEDIFDREIRNVSFSVEKCRSARATVYERVERKSVEYNVKARKETKKIETQISNIAASIKQATNVAQREVQLVQQARKRVMAVICLSDAQPVQCEELPSWSPEVPAHDVNEPRRQSCDDDVFTIQVLSPTPAVEPGCSASLDDTPDTDRRTADNSLKPAATIQRQCTTRLNRATALKQIVAELEDETRAINDGVKLPTAPSFRSAAAMLASIESNLETLHEEHEAVHREVSSLLTAIRQLKIRSTKQVAVSKIVPQDIGGRVVGPWVLRRTNHWDIEDEALANADHYEPSGTDSQEDERPGRSSDGAPWTNAGARRGSSQSLWTEIIDSTGEDINQGNPPGLLGDEQSENGLVSSKVGQAESTKGALSTSDSGQLEAASRRLLLISLIVVCFITIGLVLGGHEKTTVGALMPGSQEWLHYHFFHLPKERGRQ